MYGYVLDLLAISRLAYHVLNTLKHFDEVTFSIHRLTYKINNA
jgi:hypothetical protein